MESEERSPELSKDGYKRNIERLIRTGSSQVKINRTSDSSQWSTIQLRGVEQDFILCFFCWTARRKDILVAKSDIDSHPCFKVRQETSDSPDDIPLHSNRAFIEKLILLDSPRIGFVPNVKGKSDVWTQFQIITLDDQPVNFAVCVTCRGIITYRSRTGTGSMTRHNCRKLMVKRQQERKEVDTKRIKTEPAEIVEAWNVEIPCREFTAEPEPESRTSSEPRYMTPTFEESNNDLAMDKCQQIKKRRVNLFKKTLSLIELFKGEEFLDFAQSLIDLGADYGRVDARTLFSDDSKLFDLIKTNFE